MNDVIIRYALSSLNDRNNGKSIFEFFCQNLISQYIDHNFMPSSGSDAGGDGGVDGWSLLGQNSKIKYAFSIDKKCKAKIESEINKTDFETFTDIRFFSNQPIKQKIKEDIYKKYNTFSLTIFDLDDLVQYVKQHIDLGKFISLPIYQNNITIDYLKKHNQLENDINQISQYIPRTINILGTNRNNLINLSLIDYCSKLPQFTILQAPAGYGKTCALQQLHQKILENETQTLLPPAFISLSSYVPTTLLTMIREAMTESGDYRCNDFLLLADGYDEVKDSERESLIKEINQLLNNTGFIRKVILTVRENTYNFSDFDEFNDQQISILNKLSKDDIEKLFVKESIPDDIRDHFFNNTFFLEFSDNIFYVIKFIEYFRESKSIADNVTELFDFIINQEIDILFRKKKPTISNLESIALYMTINQIITINDFEITNQFDIKLPMVPFQFSHKSILEYIAARKIAKQPIDKIKQILAIDHKVIPYLTNTLGFVLNILNSIDNRQADFEELVTWTLQGTGNARKLLQIESDKISSSMNQKIFKAVLEQETKIGDLFNQPEGLVTFGLLNTNKDANIVCLINFIKLSINTNKFHYYTSMLQSITYHHKDLVDGKYQNDLLQFLFKLCEPENIDNNSDFISSLLHSISYFPVLKNLNLNVLESFVKKVLSKLKNEDIFNNLCDFILTSGKIITVELFLEMYDFIIDRRISESCYTAHIVPSQTTDDTYHEPLKLTFWKSFISLSKTLLNSKPFIIWEIIKKSTDKLETIEKRHELYSEFDDLFKLFYSFLIQEIIKNDFDKDKENIIINWIICEHNAYLDSKLWNALTESSISIDLLMMTKKIINKEKNHYFDRSFLDYFIKKGVISENEFDKFKGEFYKEENEHLKSFFESFCFDINERSRIYHYVNNNIPDTLKERIEKFKSNILDRKTQSEIKQALKSQAYHVAFNISELTNEVNLIFDYFNDDKIDSDSFWEHYHGDLDINRNPFALYLISTSFSPENKIITKNQIIEYLEENNWNKNFMIFLLQYISRNKIDYNDFDKHEKELIIEWVKLVLDEYPLDNINSTLRQIHITLSLVIRKFNFLTNDKEIMNSYKEKFIGLAFSGFPNVIEGAIMISYESFSLDYLDKYFSPRRIIAFINDHFEYAFSDSRKMISICGYITGHISNIFPYQKKNMKEKITKYIENNLKENYYPTIIDFAFTLGFSITDLDIKTLSEAIILDDKEHKLAYNYAESFLRYHRIEKSTDEIKHLSKALYKAFENSTVIFLKKVIAEYYISFNIFAGDIFEFYANYLLENDLHDITTNFIHGSSNLFLRTADINHLEIVNKLFKYSREKESRSERRDGIFNIALSSYKAIAEYTKKRDELDVVINSIKSFADKGDSFLYKQIQEIENAFIERTYVPLSLEEIINLKN